MRRDIPIQATAGRRWIVFDANYTAVTVIHDVALLHEGCVVVTQEESGLSIGRYEKQIVRLDPPACRFVLSDAADRVVARATSPLAPPRLVQCAAPCLAQPRFSGTGRRSTFSRDGE